MGKNKAVLFLLKKEQLYFQFFWGKNSPELKIAFSIFWFFSNYILV